MKRGDAARRSRRWADAADAYGAALAEAARSGVPEGQRLAIEGELGLCELELGKHREAAEHLREPCDHPEGLRPDQRFRFERGFRKAASQLAVIVVGVNPSDAEVSVDGRLIGSNQGTYVVYVEPGIHTVRARMPGRFDGVQTIDAVRGKDTIVSVESKEVPAAVPAAAASPAPVAAPASVAASASAAAPAPAPAPAAAPAPAPAAAPASAAAPAAGERSRIGPLQTAGIALAATTTALGAGALIWSGVMTGDIDERAEVIRRTSKDSAACAHPSAECSELRGRVERRDALDTIGIVGLGVGAGVAAVTLVLIGLAPDGPERDSAPRVAPMMGEHAGLLVHGAW
ncbi:MAG: hypothetical protein IT372_09470 [Polyangiaceae bacterium]|nr:hypothetical protein [Polyangiaceae bacterium]